MDYLSNTENIRNICILAHVDHGKTTIADSLIASNGIISHKMAGKMRYLDNRQDEQERGITMKSSSIALKYTDHAGAKYLVNLIDTPGHVDFCGEVSAAVRLCDGALIVVDVVEGVCPQTKVALEQAWKEGIEPILILNKIDRLILEQKLDETTAHLRLNQLLEQVNAIVATLLTTELFEDESQQDERSKRSNPTQQSQQDSESIKDNVSARSSNLYVYDWASAIESIDDDKYYFMPQKNNVVFSSSIDDWAFTIGSFADILSKRHKINLTALQKTLWGDYYIDTKQKRILSNAQSKAKKTLFTSMVLENIWRIYDTIAVRRDRLGMSKICQALGIDLPQRDMNHIDSRYQTKLIMSKWLQLSDNVLDAVSKIVPSPKRLSEKRVERLLSSNLRRFQQLLEETKRLKSSFMACSSGPGSVKVACISKMIPIERKNLPEFKANIVRRPVSKALNLTSSDPSTETTSDIQTNSTNQSRTIEESTESDTIFIAFARVFSGSINKGDKLYVLGPRHDPSQIDVNSMNDIDETRKLEDLSTNEHVTVATIENVYLLMGREIEGIDCALAGNVVGIRGLDKHLIRTATLSSDIYCPPFNDLHLPATPILRVAIEPKNPLEMQILMNGLKLLNQADPCVEVKLQHTGEHVIVATGEVHLQHCIKDLKERYANNIELNVSQPIVPFRETIVSPPKTDMVNETIDDNNMISDARKQQTKNSVYELLTPNKSCRIRIKASPIPENVLEFLNKSGEPLRIISKLVTSRQRSNAHQSIQQLSDFDRKKVETFRADLKVCFDQVRPDRSERRNLSHSVPNIVDRIWSFGPKYSGPNLLIADHSLNFDYSQWSRIAHNENPRKLERVSLSDYIDSFISGFQLASQSGPLCEEPMMGVCFTIMDWSTNTAQLGLSESAVTEPLDEFAESSNERSSSRLSVDCSPDDDAESMTSSQCVQRDNYGPMSGQIISTVKECCRKAFQTQPQRLMSPMFSCDIQVTTDVLGKMYAVLGRRHGRILHGDMREGSQTFEIKAFIPVIESLDFVNEIRKKTSGMANPQLIFSHYEIIDVDPFWTPSTEEEYTLFGEKADTDNLARKYVNLVRRRKGLAVQEKLVEHGEKQRTIKRNK